MIVAAGARHGEPHEATGDHVNLLINEIIGEQGFVLFRHALGAQCEEGGGHHVFVAFGS